MKYVFIPNELGDKVLNNIKGEVLEVADNAIISTPHTIYNYNPCPNYNDVFWISKLALRRTLRQYNLESALDNFLNTNNDFKSDYLDAQKLKSDDVLLVNALQDISNQTGIVIEQIKTILYNCRDE